MANKQADGNYMLGYYLIYHTQNWEGKQVGNIMYHYYKDYPFNLEKAQQASQFLSQLIQGFELGKKSMEYYIFHNCNELENMKGFTHFINGLNGTM